MRSCSRIARRCGEVDARTRTLPGLPDLLRRPAVRPRPVHPLVPRLRPLGRRLDLDQILDLETVRAEEPDPLAVADVEVDRRPRPATRSGACRSSRARAASPFGGSSVRHRERAVDEEDQLAARPQEPRRFGDPQVGVAPDRGAVLGERDVEARVRKRHVLGRRLDQRELRPVLGHEPPRVRELRVRDVDADRARAHPREPGRPVGGAAAELDDVLPGHVRKHAAAPLPGTCQIPQSGSRLAGPAATAALLVLRAPPSPTRPCSAAACSLSSTCAPSRSPPSASAAPRPSPPASGTSTRRPPAAGSRSGPRS